MLCSKCSDQVLPILAVDIDGTLAQYHEPLTEFAVRYYGVAWPKERWWDGHGDFEDYLGITQAEYRQMKLAYRQGGFKRFAPQYPLADHFMMMMRGLKAEIWITTTRPWSRLDNIDPDTKFWLENHRIKYDHLMYDEDKYKILAQLVEPERVVMVLDDLSPMVMQAEDSFPDAWTPIMARPHNKSTREGHSVVLSYTDAYQRGAKLVQAWHQQR